MSYEIKRELDTLEFIAAVDDIADMYFDINGEYQPHIGFINAMGVFYKYCVISGAHDDLFAQENVGISEMDVVIHDKSFLTEFRNAITNSDEANSLSFGTAYRCAMDIVETRKTSIDRIITLGSNMLKSLIDKITPVLTDENIANVKKIAEEIGKVDIGDSIVTAYANQMVKDESGERIMPVARNMQQLEAMLRKELSDSMNEVATKSMEDMKEATEYFYEGSYPSLYSRTGALGNTPRVTPVRKYGNLVSFKAYLDLRHTYNTGDKPDMLQVLNLADYGQPWITSSGNPARPTIGHMGFWERAEKNMKKSLDETLRRRFT